MFILDPYQKKQQPCINNLFLYHSDHHHIEICKPWMNEIKNKGARYHYTEIASFHVWWLRFMSNINFTLFPSTYNKTHKKKNLTLNLNQFFSLPNTVRWFKYSLLVLHIQGQVIESYAVYTYKGTNILAMALGRGLSIVYYESCRANSS